MDGILDAAEQLFVDVGYERASTNHIAAQAGISIGSLYQFFANKESLLQAVGSRYAQGFFAALDAEAQHWAPGDGSTARLITQLIDNIFAYGRGHLGYVAISLNASEGSALAKLTEQFQKLVWARLGWLIAQVAAQHGVTLSEEESLFYARVSNAAMRPLLIWSITELRAGNAEAAQRILDAAKRMQVAYFERLLETTKARHAELPGGPATSSK